MFFPKLFALSFFSFILISPLWGLEISKDNCAFEDPKRDLCLSPYPTHTLIGSEVWLRPVFPDDWVKLVPIFTNHAKMKYFKTGTTSTPEEVKEHTRLSSHQNLEFKQLETDLQTDKGFSWAFFGHQGFSGLITIFQSGDLDRLEIAYCGSGGTAKSAQLVLDYIKRPFLATVHPENVASSRVLIKLGFIPDLSRQGVSKFGSVRDYYLLDRPQKKKEPLEKLKVLGINKATLTLFALLKLDIIKDSTINEQSFDDQNL